MVFRGTDLAQMKPQKMPECVHRQRSGEFRMRILRVAVRILVVAMGVNTLCLIGTAAADTPAVPNPATGAGPPTISSQGSSNSPANDVILYTCGITIDYPHQSGINISVHATTTCTPAVSFVAMATTLWRVGTPPAINVPVSTALSEGTSTIQGNPRPLCVPGNYYAATNAGILFPDGSQPLTGLIGAKTPILPITC